MQSDPSDRPMVLRPFGLAVVWVVWTLAVLALVAIFGTAALAWVLVVIAPPALMALWVGQSELADRLSRLQSSVGRLEKPVASSPTDAMEARLAELAATAARTEARLATFTSTRARTVSGGTESSGPAPSVHAAQKKPSPSPGPKSTSPAKPKLTITGVTPVYTEQRQLALGAEDSAPQEMPVPEIVKALNFPDDERDTAGFAALRRALKDPAVGRLVKASQDVLTLLSQDGIYMDDLPPDRAKPAVWRRFAQGERGRAMAELGGVRDRSSLALSAGRMREDVIFRDAAHHFLRLFDRTLMALEPRATDADLVALTDTRTARAFMLLGRVAGTFD